MTIFYEQTIISVETSWKMNMNMNMNKYQWSLSNVVDDIIAVKHEN